MNNRNCFVIFLILFAIAFSVDAYAAITGTVTDIQGNPVGGALITFTDESNPYNYLSDYTDKSGGYEISLTPVLVDNEIPIQLNLFQNYPNPFNPTTTISYSLVESGHVTLTVYNIMGQYIRTLVDNSQSAGLHNIIWDGSDDTGNAAGAGIYLYQLKSGNRIESKKMLLIDGGNTFYDGKASNSNSKGVSAGKTATITENSTYRVKITEDDIVTYEEGGILLTDGGIYNFIVVRIPVTSFVSIPGGTFEMGDEVGDLWGRCRPVHTVTVSDFEMSIYEITNTQYARFLIEAQAAGNISATHWSVKGITRDWGEQEYLDLEDTDSDIVYNQGVFVVVYGHENLPVTDVTWYGAKAFALFYGLDLPTEAEWEYACRGGSQYRYGTDDGTIDYSKANYNVNVGNRVDVGSYPANPFGLYDICGNLQEWCHDWYGDYTSRSANNPTGPSFGYYRILRGGSWIEDAYYCRSAGRQDDWPYSSYNYIGFRVVRRPGGVTY